MGMRARLAQKAIAALRGVCTRFDETWTFRSILVALKPSLKQKL